MHVFNAFCLGLHDQFSDYEIDKAPQKDVYTFFQRVVTNIPIYHHTIL